MEFDNSFDVPLAPADAWAVLMDIRRIAPCMPGAALTEIIDPQNFRGKIAVRLGPVALAFAGTLQLENIDEVNRSAQVKAQGADDKGRGSANATATFRLEPSGTGSRVLIHTDLMLSGAVAQYQRLPRQRRLQLQYLCRPRPRQRARRSRSLRLSAMLRCRRDLNRRCLHRQNRFPACR
jgi:carbon monoxide dehydrogenase subunit G